MTTPSTPASPASATPSSPSRRKPLLLAISAIFVLAAAGYGAWWMTSGRYHEQTDNAYVSGNVIQITPQVAGTVVSIHADDTDQVKAGQPLVKLDPADAENALAQAEAELAQAVRQVRGLYAMDESLAASLNQREAELARARADLARRQPLLGSGAVADEDILHAREAVAVAEAAVTALRKQQEAAHAQVDQTRLAQHPTVSRAAARVQDAWLNLARTQVLAPSQGFVARRGVQVGQKVAAGAPLMALVPLDQVWVDANFKESQLRHMRIGQPVTLTADIYGSNQVFHGTVTGLSAGTGAAFSLLPAQNATGNWIKVVQRVPVRVRLDAQELSEHPLRVGLSMEAEVDTRDQSGPQLATGSTTETVASTHLYADAASQARARVAEIIAANGGATTAPGRPIAQHATDPRP